MNRKQYFIVKNALIKDTIILLEGQVWFHDKNVFQADPDEKKVNQFHRVRKHYQRTPLLRQRIHVEIGKMEYTIPLDKQGAFSSELPYVHSNNSLPAIRFHFHDNDESLPIEDLFPQTIWDFSEFKFGIISDVDDTIVISHASRMFKKLYHLLFKNAYRRESVDPVRDFYQDLESEGGKVFYVSNSEYNLYFLYREFMEDRSFPEGPLFLSPRLRGKHLLGVKHKGRSIHKIHTITQILRYFPEKKFFLVGDSGQKDSRTYYHIAEKYSERIAGIIIRDIGIQNRNKYVQKYQIKSKAFKIPFFHIHQDFEFTDILEDLHKLILGKVISEK